MKLKFTLNQLLLSFKILFSLLYVYHVHLRPKRREIWADRDKPNRPWYHWYADTYETGFGSDERNYLNSTYGVYEFVTKIVDGKKVPDYERFYKLSTFKKWILQIRWTVFRNGIWNMIIRDAPPEPVEDENGLWENEVCHKNTGYKNCRVWRNMSKHGVQEITWTVDGVDYFRYSFTKKIIGNLYINWMLGTGGSGNRDVIKLRFFIYKPVKHQAIREAKQKSKTKITWEKRM